MKGYMSMVTTESCEMASTVKPVEQGEMERVEGGVMPMFDANGRMITCTDPIRWRNPGSLFPSPFRF
jgi:hypothetical protein